MTPTFLVESFYDPTLTSPITATDTTISVSSAPLSVTSGYCTLEEGTAREELIYFGGVSGSTLTSCLRGLQKYGTTNTEVTANKFAHNAGVKLKMTPNHFVFNKKADDNEVLHLAGTETITGTKTFTSTNKAKYNAAPTFSDNEELITKRYADALAIAGSPDGSDTVKGLFEEATLAELDAGTAAGGTSARLTVNPSILASSIYATRLPTADEKAALAGTTGSPSASNKYVTDTDTRVALPTYTAGEGITAKMPVYLKASDGKVYKSVNTSNEATFAFLGFAMTTVSTNDTVAVQPTGVVTGLSGLTIGSWYFVGSTAGVMLATVGHARQLRLGRALSTTTLLIDVGPKVYIANQTQVTATSTVTITTGFPVTYVKVDALCYDSSDTSYSISSGTAFPSGVYGTYGVGATDPGDAFALPYRSATNIIQANTGIGSSPIATIDTFTQTGFNLNFTLSASDTVDYTITAIG